MSDHVQFLLLGLGNGAVYAALALALVMTFRSSGVVNFGTSATALVTAYIYAHLRKSGDLLLLVPGLPESIDLGGPFGFVPALALSLVMAAALGLAMYLGVFRPLRRAPQVASAVASIGVMLLLQAILNLRFASTPIQVESIFPRGTIELGDIRVPADRVWFAVTIAMLTLILVAVMRFTRFGLATRAVAESEVGAVISGLAPDRVAVVNWMLSSAVAGLGGILIAPIVPLAPVSYSLFIVPALAAALLGGFTALGPTVAGAFMLGMLQSEAVYLEATTDWAPQRGFPELVTLFVVLLVLIVRGKPLPTRGAILSKTLSRAPRPRRLAPPTVIGTTVGVVALVLTDGSWRGAMVTSMVVGIITLSFVVVTGFAGQISLAQLTIAGASGFFLSALTHHWSVLFPVAPLLAATGAALIGIVFGLPALRIRGLTAGIVTLALAVAVDAFWFRNHSLNGGGSGAVVEGPELFGLDLSVGSGKAYPRLPFAFLCLAVLVVVAVGVARLRLSRLGSSMLAVRANERSAAAAGVDVVRVKLLAFGIAAFIAGIGGAMLAYHRTVITVESYGIFVGLSLFVTVYMAGITSVSGGIAAGALAVGGLNWLVFERWLDFGEWYEFVTAMLLVFAAVKNPEGFLGPIHQMLLRRRTGRDRLAEPAPDQAPVVHAPVTTRLRSEPSQSPHPAALSLVEVGVSYGGVVALESVTFDVAQGSIVGLIGPNGAGKTTLIDAVSGFAPHRGSVLLAGSPLGDSRAHQRVERGLSRTFQAIDLYDDLTVVENILVGQSTRRARRDAASCLSDTLDLLGLGPYRQRPAGELSHGHRQLVSIARALVAQPTVLMLDEPAGGLDNTESQWLRERLQSVRAQGVTILLVDHDMNLVLSLCDRVVVLDFGRVIAEGTAAEIRADQRVMQAYLGSMHDSTEHQIQSPPAVPEPTQ